MYIGTIRGKLGDFFEFREHPDDPFKKMIKMNKK